MSGACDIMTVNVTGSAGFPDVSDAVHVTVVDALANVAPDAGMQDTTTDSSTSSVARGSSYVTCLGGSPYTLTFGGWTMTGGVSSFTRMVWGAYAVLSDVSVALQWMVCVPSANWCMIAGFDVICHEPVMFVRIVIASMGSRSSYTPGRAIETGVRGSVASMVRSRGVMVGGVESGGGGGGGGGGVIVPDILTVNIIWAVLPDASVEVHSTIVDAVSNTESEGGLHVTTTFESTASSTSGTIYVTVFGGLPATVMFATGEITGGVVSSTIIC